MKFLRLSNFTDRKKFIFLKLWKKKNSNEEEWEDKTYNDCEGFEERVKVFLDTTVVDTLSWVKFSISLHFAYFVIINSIP